jgi:hypothetical protein
MIWLHLSEYGKNPAKMTDEEIVELIESIPDTCELDVVARYPDGVTLQEIANQLGGVSREWIRQLEARALRQLTAKVELHRYRQYREYAGYESHVNYDPYAAYLPDLEGVETTTRGTRNGGQLHEP